MTENQILTELQPIVAQFGRMPKQTMLQGMRKGELARAIVLNGGFRKFSRLMNTTLMQYYQAIDNHLLSSSYECIFDNILHKHNIKHEIQVRVVDDRRYRCDFYIGETYIEILGYTRKENPGYFSRLNKKIRLYRENRKSFLLIPKHVFEKNKEKIEAEVLRRLGGLISYKDNGPSRKDLDIMDFKPRYYWADPNNVEKHLLPLLDKYGRMPRDAEFRREREGALATAIYKYHGSPFQLGQKLGVTVLNRPKGYFSGKNGVAIHNKLCQAKGKFLTRAELIRLGYHSLLKVASENGGLYKLRQKSRLNFPAIRGEYGKYTLEKTVRDYKKVCKQKEKFLTRKELYSMGLVQLANTIVKNGGLYVIREKTGLNYLHEMLPPGYHSIEGMVEKYKIKCEEKGYFLTKSALSATFSAKALGLIDRNVGFSQLRIMTGLKFEVKKKRRKNIYSPNKATIEYAQLCKKAGGFLEEKELRLRGADKLAWFISVRIGFKVIRKRTGLKFPSKKRIAYQKAVKQYKLICIKRKRLLTARELTKLGFGLLAGAIERLGGFARIRKATGLTFSTRAPKRSLSAVVREYNRISKLKGFFPTAGGLRRLGYDALNGAIVYRGGLRKIRKLTKLTLPTEKSEIKGSSIKFENVLSKFTKLSIRNGAFFSKSDFVAIGAEKYAWFIQNNGGYRKFQRLSGLKIEDMHKPNQKAGKARPYATAHRKSNC